MGFLIAYLAIVVLAIAGLWKTFEKAGQPGWAAIVPFFNLYIMLKVAGRPGWWLLLFLIPIVSLVIAIMVASDVSRNFGRGTGTTIGLIFLPFIFYPILGFGEAEYRGPVGG